jgi:hypothetical protein
MPILSDRSQSYRFAFMRKVVGVAILLAVAFGFSWGLNLVARRLDQDNRPAGFSRGLAQGALMPFTWPTLLAAQDVVIYSNNNNGIPYKLGYTLGVNLCGFLLLGLIYLRLDAARYRK